MLEGLGSLIIDSINLLTVINLGFYGGTIRPLDSCHGAAIALELKLSQVGVNCSWMHRFVTYFLVAIGGGIVVGVVAGTHIPWLTANGAFTTYTAMFLGVYFFPKDLMTSLLIRQPFYFLFRLFDSFSWGHAITSWGIDYALGLGLTSFPMRIIVGFLSGAGGGLVTEMFCLKEDHWGFKAPHNFFSFPFDAKVTLALSVFYSVTVLPMRDVCSGELQLDGMLEWLGEWLCMVDEPVKAIVILTLVPIYFLPKLGVKQVLKKHSGRKKRRQLLRERKKAKEEAERKEKEKEGGSEQKTD